MVQQLTDN